MPRCAAFVDDLREAFGVEEINDVIRRGLRQEAKPEHQVHFVEAAHELGRPIVGFGRELQPVLPLKSAQAAGKGRR